MYNMLLVLFLFSHLLALQKTPLSGNSNPFCEENMDITGSLFFFFLFFFQLEELTFIWIIGEGVSCVHHVKGAEQFFNWWGSWDWKIRSSRYQDVKMPWNYWYLFNALMMSSSCNVLTVHCQVSFFHSHFFFVMSCNHPL